MPHANVIRKLARGQILKISFAVIGEIIRSIFRGRQADMEHMPDTVGKATEIF